MFDMKKWLRAAPTARLEPIRSAAYVSPEKNLDQFLAKLCEVARPLILRQFAKDSCIASTRIGLDVCRHFGLKARAVPMRVIIYNPEAKAEIERRNRVHEVDEIDNSFPLGSKQLLLGFKGDGVDDAETFQGHLGLLVEGDRLVDLSLDQARRDEWGIKIGPGSMPVDPLWVNGDIVSIAIINGSMCCFIAGLEPDNATAPFWTSPDWTRPDPHRGIVKDVVAALAGMGFRKRRD